MADKNKADQSAGLKKTHINDASSSAQLYRLLEHFRLQPVGMITACSKLNIMMQAARVKELSERGHNIRHHLITLTGDHDRCHHRVALYVLSTTSVKAEA